MVVVDKRFDKLMETNPEKVWHPAIQGMWR